MNDSMHTSSRKEEHVRLCTERDVRFRQKTTGFERYEFDYVALPELDFDEIETQTTFLGRTLRLPLIVSSMTGGYVGAEAINAALAECCQHHLFTQPEEGIVLVALTLGEDHRAFRLHLRRLEQTVAHAIRFQTDGQINLLCRQGVEVSGPIQIGEGIPGAALAVNGFVQYPGWECRGAFELHMFNPMGEAGLAGGLVAQPDPIPHPMTDQRSGVDLLQQNL